MTDGEAGPQGPHPFVSREQQAAGPRHDVGELGASRWEPCKRDVRVCVRDSLSQGQTDGVGPCATEKSSLAVPARVWAEAESTQQSPVS